MQVPQPSVVVAVIIFGTAAYAFTRNPPAPEIPAPIAAGSSESLDDETNTAGEDEESVSDDLEPDDEPPAIRWSAPATWPAVPNPSALRIATHRVPRAAGDAEDAELGIARAGGETEANIERWMGQFTQSSPPRRSEKTVHGFPVTIVAIEGTYESGMTEPTPHAGWALLGAIVQTPGLPYFFKLTGPAATVRAARPSFDAMLADLQPATP